MICMRRLRADLEWHKTQEEMLARRATTQEIGDMKMKLKSRRVRSVEELWAIEDRLPAVCGPSPSAFAARHGLKFSKPYVAFLRGQQQANGNGAHKPVPRRKLVAR
jgi:hypothetical protein